MFLLALVLGVSAPSGEFSSAQEALLRGVTRECQHHYSTEFQARELESLDALPGQIREKLVSHLKARLGDVFYDRLRYRHGLVFNSKDVGSGSRDAKIPAFHFEFDLSLPEAGVKQYCAQIDLGTHGSILREIDLPEVARDATKGTIVPLTEALRLAEVEGVPREEALIELGYEASPGCIVWQISYTKKDERGDTVLLTCDINAHTGKKIKWYAQDIRFHKPA